MGSSPRRDALWLGEVLRVQITNELDVCNGAALCHLVNVLWPDSIPSARISWKAVTTAEVTRNFELAYKVLDKHDIEHSFQLADLIDRRPAAAARLLRWCREMYDNVSRTRKDSGPRRSAVAAAGPAAKAPDAGDDALDTQIRELQAHIARQEAAIAATKAAMKEHTARIRREEEQVDKERALYSAKLAEIGQLIDDDEPDLGEAILRVLKGVVV